MNDEKTVIEPETETTQNIKKRKPRKKKSRNFAVTNEELLYKIADAGLLCELRGLRNEEPRTWYFNKNPDVKAVIDQFQAAGGEDA